MSFIPCGIEGAKVIHHCLDGHPIGKLLVLGDIADVGEGFTGEGGRRSSKDGCSAVSGTQDVEHQLDERGLAGTVMADEGEDGASRNGQIEWREGFGVAEGFGESVGFDGGHGGCNLEPPAGGVVRRFQWRVIAAVMSSRSMERRLASTTSSSI